MEYEEASWKRVGELQQSLEGMNAGNNSFRALKAFQTESQMHMGYCSEKHTYLMGGYNVIKEITR